MLNVSALFSGVSISFIVSVIVQFSHFFLIGVKIPQIIYTECADIVQARIQKGSYITAMEFKIITEMSL